MKLRQSPRLKDFDYIGPFAYQLTFVTRGRMRAFRSEEDVVPCLGALARACDKERFRTLAYCFMPDHAHVLVEGEVGSRLGDFCRYFKQLSGYDFKRRRGLSLWQTSYYDHVVRRDEDIRQIAAYIWDNPVRAGLAEDRLKFPYSGPRELMEQAKGLQLHERTDHRKQRA